MWPPTAFLLPASLECFNSATMSCNSNAPQPGCMMIQHPQCYALSPCPQGWVASEHLSVCLAILRDLRRVRDLQGNFSLAPLLKSWSPCMSLGLQSLKEIKESRTLFNQGAVKIDSLYVSWFLKGLKES